MARGRNRVWVVHRFAAVITAACALRGAVRRPPLEAVRQLGCRATDVDLVVARAVPLLWEG
eukprot:3644094-Prymnesium_polylepis.1